MLSQKSIINPLVPFIIIITVFCNNLIHADTLILHDGSVLVGKIVLKDEKTVIFKNSYGLFKVKKELVQNAFKTKDYQQDITIHKKYGKKIDEVAIKKDFLAGLDKLEETKAEYESKQKRDELPVNSWDYGKITINAIYLKPLGKYTEVLPMGYGGYAAYDQGIGPLIDKRAFWMPGFRLEGGYFHFEKDSNSMVKGPIWAGGLIWLVPINDYKWGSIFFGGTAGVSHLEIISAPYKTRSNTLTSHAIFGYEIPVGRLFLSLTVRYMYIFDKDIDMHSIGGALGVGLRLW